jgi:hypothetical protein
MKAHSKQADLAGWFIKAKATRHRAKGEAASAGFYQASLDPLCAA